MAVRTLLSQLDDRLADANKHEATQPYVVPKSYDTDLLRAILAAMLVIIDQLARR